MTREPTHHMGTHRAVLRVPAQNSLSTLDLWDQGEGSPWARQGQPRPPRALPVGDFSPVAVSLPRFLYSSLSLSFSVCLSLPHPPSHSQLFIWSLFSHSFIHSPFTAKPGSTLHPGSFPAELSAWRTPAAASGDTETTTLSCTDPGCQFIHRG